jgi:tetratricopeptide (TPR) repeat protein
MTSAAELTDRAIAICATNTPMAVKLLNTATSLDPAYGRAWRILGDIESQIGCTDAAAILYQRALAVDGEDVASLVNLSKQAYWTENLPLAREAAERALELDLTAYQAWINLSLIESVCGNLDESLDCARRARSIRDNHETQLAMSFATLYSGDFAAGLAFHEARFENQLKGMLEIPIPRWAGEDLAEKSLVIISEQGIGDVLSFMRFVPAAAVAAKSVALMVHPELLRLIDAAMLVYPNVKVFPTAAPYPPADFWTTFMSLPVPLGLSTAEIISQEDIFWPEFRTSSALIRPAAKLNVGICWAGNKDCAIEKFRRVPLRSFAPLALIPGVQLYSLQVGECSNEIHNTGFSTFVVDCAPAIRDVGDTFALLKKLDLVICAETAVGHMTGVLGIPTWILYSTFGRDFRLGHEGKSIWYPNHRVFKQRTNGDWARVMVGVAAMLERRAEGIK